MTTDGITTPLWAHQVEAYEFARQRRASMLALEMGTGKTLTTLALLHSRPLRRALIVCPKSVVPVWPREFERHTDGRYHVHPLVKGTSATKARELAHVDGYHESVVFVVNYESAWRDTLAEALLAREWDWVILDESHRIKSHRARSAKFLWRLGTKAWQRVCLTGTPLPHSPLDAFGQYRFLDPQVFGYSFTRFRARYALVSDRFPSQVRAWLNMDEFEDRFHGLAIRKTKDECLDLPEFVHATREVDLSPDARRTYKSMAQDLVAEVEGGTITAANALSRLLRLQQITGGTVTDEDGIERPVGREKQAALVDLLEDTPREDPVVVFGRFRADLDRIREAADADSRTCYELSGRRNELAEWQEAESGEVLAVQIQAGGVGVDLTRARTAVYYSLGYSLGEYEQSLARVHRPGQRRPVLYVHLVARDTVDEQVYAALQKRKNVVESVLDAMHLPTGGR